MHVRSKWFTVLCSPTDRSDKTQLMCSNPSDVFYYVVPGGWATVPCPTTKLSLLIPKSFVGIKQSMISVSLKTPLKNKMGNPYLQNFTSASARRLYLFYIKLSPHISQQNAPMVETSNNLMLTRLTQWQHCMLPSAFHQCAAQPHGLRRLVKGDGCLRISPADHLWHYKAWIKWNFLFSFKVSPCFNTSLCRSMPISTSKAEILRH